MADLKLDFLRSTADESVALAADGAFTVQASGGVPPLRLVVAEDLNAAQPLTAGQPVTVDGLSAYTYHVQVFDSADASVSGTVVIRVHQVLGCTDPAALNPTAGATAEDGSCRYAAPAAPAAYFLAPLLQALRFVPRTSVPAGSDGQLFCEQARPGLQQRPCFYQLVEEADSVRVQVLTSYAAVTATLYQHGGAGQQTGPAVSLVRVLTLEGPADPLTVTLAEDRPTGLTRLTPGQGLGLPTSLLQAARLTLAGAATGTYRVRQALAGTALAPADSLLLNRPWMAVSGAVTATWLLSGPGFNVFEAELPVAGLGPGAYWVQLRGRQAGWPDAVADSEPFAVQAHWPDTLAVDFTNVDNAFGAVFATGLTPRLRVKATLFRQGNGGELSTYADSRAQTTVLSASATRILPLETYGLPAWLHEKLFLACRLDSLVVAGVRCASPAAYSYELPRAYPLGAGRVELLQANWPLGAANGDDSGAAPTNALQLRGGGYLLLRGGH